MSDIERLTDSNLIMYAMKMYQNPGCLDVEEFYDDFKKIKYLKSLFNRYKETGELKERLILNHLIVFYNVFSPDAATKILFYKLPKEFWPQLKTFLVYLSFMPERICGVIDNSDIMGSEIPLDPKVVQVLRRI